MSSIRVPHIVYVSQKVVDVKPPKDIGALKERAGSLVSYLRRFSIISGKTEKVSASLRIDEVTADGVVHGFLEGSSFATNSYVGIEPTVKVSLPVGLEGYAGPLEIEHVFGALPGGTVDDGGNIQNMFLDSLVLCAALARRHPEFGPESLRLTIASSSDPFLRVGDGAASFQDRAEVFGIDLADRLALHLPWELEGESGVLAVTSEPMETSGPLHRLLNENAQFAKAFRSATCFISADPFFELLPTFGLAPYAYVINASTAFRTLVAVRSYMQAALLPMNDGEASEVCRLMLARGRGSELDVTERPKFLSPLDLSGEGIDMDALKILDRSLDFLLRYNPVYRRIGSEEVAFACPISFGSQGGMIIGTNSRMIACFTSILSKEGEQRLFQESGIVPIAEVRETGAGDVVASIISLFDAVGPEVVVKTYFRGAEGDHADFRNLSSTIFVSVLGRVVGNLLVRTMKTTLADIDPEKLGALIEEVASESVAAARRVVKLLPEPAYTSIDRWGIRMTLGSPGQVAFPRSTHPLPE